MTKNKKDEFIGFKIAIGVMALIAVFNANDVYNKNFRFNPDDHICEELKSCKDLLWDRNVYQNFFSKEWNPFWGYCSKRLDNWDGASGKGKEEYFRKEICIKIRDKTPQELEIDYCNSREGLKEAIDIKEICKCLKFEKNTWIYEDETEKVVDAPFCLKATPIKKPIEINLEEEKCVEHTFEGKVPYTKKKDSYKLDCLSAKKGCLEGLDVVCKNYNYFCCTKKVKLSECEKGNPDFVEECNPNQTYANGKCYYYDSTINDTNYNKTTCREKTEVEKLKDKSCDELIQLISFNIEKLNANNKCPPPKNPKFYEPTLSEEICNRYLNYKQAFREKECEI